MLVREHIPSFIDTSRKRQEEHVATREEALAIPWIKELEIKYAEVQPGVWRGSGGYYLYLDGDFVMGYARRQKTVLAYILDDDGKRLRRLEQV